MHDPATGAVLDANRQACDLHGCTLDQLKAVGVGGVSSGGLYTEDRAHELVKRAAAGQPQRFEWQGRHTSGAEVWVEVHLQHLKILGADRVVASVLLYVEDNLANLSLLDTILEARPKWSLRLHCRHRSRAEARAR